MSHKTYTNGQRSNLPVELPHVIRNNVILPFQDEHHHLFPDRYLLNRCAVKAIIVIFSRCVRCLSCRTQRSSRVVLAFTFCEVWMLWQQRNRNVKNVMFHTILRGIPTPSVTPGPKTISLLFTAASSCPAIKNATEDCRTDPRRDQLANSLQIIKNSLSHMGDRAGNFIDVWKDIGGFALPPVHNPI